MTPCLLPMTDRLNSGAPPAGAGGSFPKRDIPRLAESIQPPAGAGGFLQRGKKYWIAFTLRPRGKLIIDDGARKALLEKGKSLLPSGIIDVEGDFDLGDPVSCVGREGTIIAKGLVNFSSAEINKIKGLKTAQINNVLGHKDYDEVIHRDNLVITKQNLKNKI